VLDQITPLVLTLNESLNIGRTLGQLAPFRHVIVVDSFSTDSTLQIATRYANVRIVQRAMDTLANQWTFATEQVTTEGILKFEADYYLK